MSNNAVIYARYSSHSQTEATIEKQIEECEKYAKNNNLTVIGNYIDRAHTGTNFERAEFQRMMHNAKSKQFNVVLIYALNRFGRDHIESELQIRKLNKLGVAVQSITENFDDSSSGDLMRGIIMEIDQFYSRELSEKLSYGIEQAAKKGQALGGPGVFGFDIVDKKYVVNNEEADIVKIIFDLFVYQHKTRAEIIKHLNDNGYKTKTGTSFKDRAVERILKNQKYIGNYVFHGEIVYTDLPKIIDEQTFYKAQELLSQNKKAPARNRKPEESYFLTNKLFCGSCGSPMSGMSGHSKYKSTVHQYYSCYKHQRKQCDMKNIRKDVIEPLVINEVLKILTDDNISKISKEVVKLSKDNSVGNKLSRLKKEKKEVEKAISYLVKAVEKGKGTDTLLNQLDKKEKELERINKNIAIEKLSQYPIEEKNVSDFLHQFVNGDIDNQEIRKSIFDILINKVILSNEDDTHKKITIICNAHNGSNDVTFDIIEGSSNTHNGGVGGTRTLVLE